MKSTIHAATGGLAMLTITLFLGSTLYSEVFGTEATIVAVKSAILLPGLVVLIPLLAMTGALGNTLAKACPGPLAITKLRRMKVIAALGLTVLVPSAVLLAYLAKSGNFGPLFVAVQIVEIAAGLTNLTLMGRNFADGVNLSKRLRVVRARAAMSAAE